MYFSIIKTFYLKNKLLEGLLVALFYLLAKSVTLPLHQNYIFINHREKIMTRHEIHQLCKKTPLDNYA